MAKTGNPFLDGDFGKQFANFMDPSKFVAQMEQLDFAKFAEQFKLPGVDTKALLSIQQKNFEAVAAANKLAVEGVQAFVTREVEIARQAMEDTSNAVSEITAADTAEAKLAKQAELAKTAYDKACSNARELTELGVKSNSDAAALLTGRVSEALSEINAQVTPKATAVAKKK